MIAGVLSLLPIVGPYFLYVVVGLLLLSSSQVNIAIGIIVYGLLIGSLLDYSLRPVMMSKKAKLHPMIIFIGIFGGMSIMGIIGIVIGPIILSIGYAFFKDLEITSK
jgi:predicted PurR-regulated permease PerM